MFDLTLLFWGHSFVISVIRISPTIVIWFALSFAHQTHAILHKGKCVESDLARYRSVKVMILFCHILLNPSVWLWHGEYDCIVTKNSFWKYKKDHFVIACRPTITVFARSMRTDKVKLFHEKKIYIYLYDISDILWNKDGSDTMQQGWFRREHDTVTRPTK